MTTAPKSTTRMEQVEGRLKPETLVGSFFHSFRDGVVELQGCVVAQPESGFYLVQLFSWLHSYSTNQHLVRIEEMLDWHFYDSAKWMDDAYEHGGLAAASERRYREEVKREAAGRVVRRFPNGDSDVREPTD